MAIITFENIQKQFSSGANAITVLQDIDLTIEDKEFVAIVGPSGCGKTTLMRMVAGFEFPSKGLVKVAGEVIKEPGPERAVVFQQFALFPWKTVTENIDLGLRNKNIDKNEREDKIAKVLKLMNLEAHANAYPHQLSGGMQQRVAIARAYVLEPQVLLMDEPFGALDAQTRVIMQEELVRLARKVPRTVLFITHSVEEAVYLADRVIVMTKAPGRIKQSLDIKSIREREAWDNHAKIEDVMDLESFVHLRTQIWKSLREEKAGG